MSQVRIHSGRPTVLVQATAIARLVLVACGAVAVVLGLLFWIGIAYVALPVHMLVGIGLTLALIALAIIAGIVGVNRSFVVLALVWAVVLPLFGYMQTRLLLGSFHWVIEVVHLLIGVAAVGLGQFLAARIKQVLKV